MAWGQSGGVDEQAVVAYPAEACWQALQSALEQHPALTVTSIDRVTHRIEFKSGWSARTSGQSMSASVARDGSGSTVTVGGVGKMPTQYGTQARLKKLIGEVLQGLSRELQSLGPPPQAGQAAAPASLSDELVKLGGLRDSGVLSADEFEAAKRRLLDS